MDFAELRRQHDEISETAKRIAVIITQSSQPVGVSQLRWQLARQLMTHLALEDRFLYPAMQRCPDRKARETASNLQAETGQLAESFSHYMSSWNEDRMIREWPAFCTETRAVLDALADRVTRENRMLYPLAEQMAQQDHPVSALRAG
ncbi:hemerythrin domain-containing protein [Sphingobium baderi]|uniref:Cation-binding protein n=1 Tax=Sphingobium baderi TaxID=1332080 RepID=A0A0S3F4Y4_9SPHN|nr:hemerythrin domain-containing protein [Sphingobium baderi]ALR22780.1 cation-binding protein [Sphingobium baderi]